MSTANARPAPAMRSFSRSSPVELRSVPAISPALSGVQKSKDNHGQQQRSRNRGFKKLRLSTGLRSIGGATWPAQALLWKRNHCQFVSGIVLYSAATGEIG